MFPFDRPRQDCRSSRCERRYGRPPSLPSCSRPHSNFGAILAAATGRMSGWRVESRPREWGRGSECGDIGDAVARHQCRRAQQAADGAAARDRDGGRIHRCSDVHPERQPRCVDRCRYRRRRQIVSPERSGGDRSRRADRSCGRRSSGPVWSVPTRSPMPSTPARTSTSSSCRRRRPTDPRIRLVRASRRRSSPSSARRSTSISPTASDAPSSPSPSTASRVPPPVLRATGTPSEVGRTRRF